MIGRETPSSACTRRPDEISADGFSSSSWPEQIPAKQGGGGGDDDDVHRRRRRETWTGPTGPGPTDEHSIHPYHRDFIITPIADQIGPIESVSKTEYYDLKNRGDDDDVHRRRRREYLYDPQWFRDTASRGPTTIVAPESQFRTCPSDHGWESRGEWVAPTCPTLTVATYSVADSVELLSPSSCIASAFYSCCLLLFYSCSPYWGLTPCPSGAWFVFLACCVVQFTQLVVELAQLEVPQEAVRVSQ
ncbi:hypothetical protein F511_12582 [Dorcoceras hygrometricum]|uniref:Uncharacterized protein n=1 Tax=Dorcoceras hygrometricum TaxID=472368 RepID=A0A2Z7A7F3_9LAMI|nr:hypothetical protein F511_12582 [Dorcoceras hygrometricum]